MTGEGASEDRVLALMPTVRDAALIGEMLATINARTVPCSDLAHLCRELRGGASAVILTDDMLMNDSCGQLAEAARAQPSWSAIPHIVVAREALAERVVRSATDTLFNVIVVERPVRVRTLISVVLSALRGRHHQYEIRDAIEARDKHAAQLMQTQAELARQAEQLRAADARKDEFLATLAHELRNPLAPIRTGIDLLSEAPKPELLAPTLAVMRRQLGHMVHLIDDLLDVSRITQGKLELKREEVTLRGVVESAIEVSRPLIDGNKHRLEVSLPQKPVWLHGDFTRIAQVISNLLNNAAKYTPRGGVIELLAHCSHGKLTIEVRDNGMGIPPDRLEDVFTMFNQVSRSLDQSRGGLGIGLALVRQLVQMHGGQVWAESEGAGRGSTFSVVLPCRMHSDSLLPTSVRPSQPPASKVVLVVDDNRDAAEMLSTMLTQSGHRTSTVHDGPAAIAAAETLRPEAIILDIGMPGMSGYDVARALRKDDRFARTALIALTGWGSREDKLRATDAGFDYHLTKPVSSYDIDRVLSEVAQRS